ncbi:MAG: TPM domain-containing protein [Verrucomicrobia bacterium]|nr:TPM domain-containing protein [Verrucomicrobiota bacterium]
MLLFLGLGFVAAGHSAEVIPPAPAAYFNDYAGIVSPGAARQLDAELTQFERDTSNQIVVAIYPKMQSDSSVEDYTVRVAQKWGVGQKDRKNGAVLFLFQESHDIRIQVGYGLEGALPDALCKRIVEDEIAPRFRQGDFTGGLQAGVHAMMAATKGEYQGTGQTVGGRHGRNQSSPGLIIVFIIIVVVISLIRGRRNNVYSRRGLSTPWISTGGGWRGGGSGGGFSGGGGSFGGGGAGGKW